MALSSSKVYLLALVVQLATESRAETTWRNPYLGLPVKDGPPPTYVMKQRSLYTDLPQWDVPISYHPLQAFPKLFPHIALASEEYFHTLFSMTEDIYPVIAPLVRRGFIKQLYDYTKEQKTVAKLIASFKDMQFDSVIARWFDLDENAYPDHIESFLSPLPLEEYLFALNHIDVTKFSFLQEKDREKYDAVRDKVYNAMNSYLSRKESIDHIIIKGSGHPLEIVYYQLINPYRQDPILFYFPRKKSFEYGNYGNYIHKKLSSGSISSTSTILQENRLLFDISPVNTPHGISINFKINFRNYFGYEKYMKVRETDLSKLSKTLDDTLLSCEKNKSSYCSVVNSLYHGQVIYLQHMRILKGNHLIHQQVDTPNCQIPLIEYAFNQNKFYEESPQWKQMFCVDSKKCSNLLPTTTLWDVNEVSFITFQEAESSVCTDTSTRKLNDAVRLKHAVINAKTKNDLKTFDHIPALRILKYSMNNFLLGEVPLALLHTLLYKKKLFKQIKRLPTALDMYYHLKHLFEIMPTKNALETLLRKYMIIDALREAVQKQELSRGGKIKDFFGWGSKRHIGPLSTQDSVNNPEQEKSIRSFLKMILNGEEEIGDAFYEELKKHSVLTVLQAFSRTSYFEGTVIKYLNVVLKDKEQYEYIKSIFSQGRLHDLTAIFGEFAQQGGHCETITELIIAASLNVAPGLRTIDISDAVTSSFQDSVDKTVADLLKKMYPQLEDQLVTYLVAYLN